MTIVIRFVFRHVKTRLYGFCFGKPRISIFPTKNVNFTSGGGGILAAVTFLCDTSWENSIFLLKSFELFGNILGRDIK